jgi:DNA primase
MLSSNTIEKVYELPIADVISKYIEIKKQGGGYKGKSPFTDEKSGSFMVSVSKNIWKCFSTGIGGNNCISFVMKYKKINWLEAITEIADSFNILLEYDDSERAKNYCLKAEKVQNLNNINQEAINYFVENLPKLDPKFKRATDAISDVFCAFSELLIFARLQ